MKLFYKLQCILFCLLSTFFSHAKDKIELETVTIKGNKELPKVLYVVPWQDGKNTKRRGQKLVLHSLFGDLFEPVIPDITTSSSRR